MKTEGMQETASAAIDIRPFKEQLRKRLPSESAVLNDLLGEPDSKSASRAES